MCEKNVRMSREDRKVQIIESAMNLFVKNGYNATTTSSIAKEAGISEVTLFRYFSSKKELFKAGLEPIIITGFQESINESKTLKDIDKLKYLIQDRIYFVSKNHELLKLILIENQINPDIIGFDYIKKILSLLEESIEETEIKFKNKDLTCRLLMGSILSFLYFPELEKDKIENYINDVVSMLMNQN